MGGTRGKNVRKVMKQQINDGKEKHAWEKGMRDAKQLITSGV